MSVIESVPFVLPGLEAQLETVGRFAPGLDSSYVVALAQAEREIGRRDFRYRQDRRRIGVAAIPKRTAVAARADAARRLFRVPFTAGDDRLALSLFENWLSERSEEERARDQWRIDETSLVRVRSHRESAEERFIRQFPGDFLVTGAYAVPYETAMDRASLDGPAFTEWLGPFETGCLAAYLGCVGAIFVCPEFSFDFRGGVLVPAGKNVFFAWDARVGRPRIAGLPEEEANAPDCYVLQAFDPSDIYGH